MTAPGSVVVQKYGGSSVATVEKLRAVARKVVDTRRAGYGVVVVVSAMGHATDDLLALAREVSSDPPKRELDMLLSVGERTSMALLSIAIAQLGEQAISFTGSQAGIVTTDSHANARIIDVRPFRVQDELEAGRIVIVAGFQGTSYRREITTLGRGGSDTTAVALAAALGAECDIYSDVDGVYTANPRVVVDARRLEAISHEEMQELARLGARVLNAQAVEFARRNQIAIYARSTFGDGTGTVITRPDGFPDTALAEIRANGVRGVTSMSDVLVCRTSTEAHVEAVLASSEADAVVFAQVDGDGVGTLALSLENVADGPGLSARLRERGVDATLDFGTVSAVGLGVGQNPVAITRMRRLLSGFGPAGFAATGQSITALVPIGRVDDATRAVHAEFIAPAS